MTRPTSTTAGGDIVWRLALKSLPERVHAAWLNPADHERFWCERSEALSPTRCQLHFIDGTVTECSVEENQPSSHIRFRYFTSQVDIHIARSGDVTDLTLIATAVPLREWTEVHAGWLNVLLPLKAWLDFGIDLRNHDARRTWAQRYADQ